jgi:hypothetical protein
MDAAEWSTRSLKKAGIERRSAERFEGREQSRAKEVQRDAVAAWIRRHHVPNERMRLLSLPDRYWTFENRMNGNNSSFIGLQRDWRTLELSIPWMPLPRENTPWANENLANPFHFRAATGTIHGFNRGHNIVLHMWAGHFLSWDNVAKRKEKVVDLRHGSRLFRRVTCAWLDFAGCLTDEVITASAGIPVLLQGVSCNDRPKEAYPCVTTFLAARDGFRDHQDRVAAFLLGIQKSQLRGNGWRYAFDRFEVHVGTCPFISVFGDYRFAQKSRSETISPDGDCSG